MWGRTELGDAERGRVNAESQAKLASDAPSEVGARVCAR
jgi:hypothetical protein